MVKIRSIQSNFTGGAVSQDLISRGDLNVYRNAALSIKNARVDPIGGLWRRDGFAHVTSLPTKGRIILFSFDHQKNFIIFLGNHVLRIYQQSTILFESYSPWNIDILHSVHWTQSADVMLLTHEDYQPHKLTKTSDIDWKLEQVSFLDKSGIYKGPFYQFEKFVSLSLEGMNGHQMMHADRDYFTKTHIGTMISIHGGIAQVQSYASPRMVLTKIIKKPTAITATKDWQESSFSDLRGWPKTISYHQNRLVFGGSRSLPNRIWFSKSDDYFNFDQGEGLDDEAIETTLLADKVSSITGLLSSRDLYIFTSDSEWRITGKPVTPTSITQERLSWHGTSALVAASIVQVQGAILFVNNSLNGIQEFLPFDDFNQEGADITLLFKRKIKDILALAYCPEKHQLFVIMKDGNLCVATVYRQENIIAWSEYETKGKFLSVIWDGNSISAIVERDGLINLEKLKNGILLDNAVLRNSNAEKIIDNLPFKDGTKVTLIKDGISFSQLSVKNRQITLKKQYNASWQIGIPFDFEVAAMPPAYDGLEMDASIRLIDLTFRLQDTQALQLQNQDDLFQVSLPSENIPDKPLEKFSGDITVKNLGWKKKHNEPLWKILVQQPCSIGLLSAKADVTSST